MKCYKIKRQKPTLTKLLLKFSFATILKKLAIRYHNTILDQIHSGGGVNGRSQKMQNKDARGEKIKRLEGENKKLHQKRGNMP